MARTEAVATWTRLELPFEVRGFVETVWEKDPAVTANGLPQAAQVWSKPDERTGSLELRELRTLDLAEVAQHAGVSASTVSYVLSGKRSISGATRQRVEDQSAEDVDGEPGDGDRRGSGMVGSGHERASRVA